MVKVEIMSRETIKPSSGHPSKRKINVVDRAMPPLYIPLIYFYPPVTTATGGDINDGGFRVEQLKKSLSESLTRFFPSAGTGRLKGENRVVECNDDGAEFLEARVDVDDPHLSLADLLQRPAVELLNLMAPRSPFHVESDTDFFLSIQVNHFRCGGLAIAVSMFHKLGDGHSLAAFVNEWARTARGGGARKQMMPPDLDSSTLFPVDGFVPELHLPPQCNVVTRRFVFDASKIAALRSRATKAEQPTRYEAVSALIWRCMAKARGGQEQDFSASLSMHAVNLRGRMVPPLAENSFGNFVVAATAVAAREELVEGKMQPGQPEMKIRGGIRKIDAEYIKELQRPNGVSKHMEGGVGADEEVEKDGKGVLFCAFAGWCRFPVYEADFSWGKPLWVSTISIPINYCTIFLSTRSGDGIEAWVSLEEEKMAKFAQDEELLSYVFFPSINELSFTLETH
ncbi:hypothetical protein ACLOJK_011897 [Asimina triloba]